jgi:hypothetical protein
MLASDWTQLTGWVVMRAHAAVCASCSVHPVSTSVHPGSYALHYQLAGLRTAGCRVEICDSFQSAWSLHVGLAVLLCACSHCCVGATP